MAISTLRLRLQFGVELEFEDDPIECVIHETHDFMYRYFMWVQQIEAAGADLQDVHSIEYHNAVKQSIIELEMLG